MKSYKVLDKVDFYETMKSWWVDWEFPVLSIDALPNNIVVVFHEDQEVYAIPLYLSDSNFCWVGFITSNKKASKKAREGSLTFGLNSVSDFLQHTGYRNLFTITSNSFIDKSLIESNFLVTNKNIKEYIKNI
jgi:hypothetical protein